MSFSGKNPMEHAGVGRRAQRAGGVGASARTADAAPLTEAPLTGDEFEALEFANSGVHARLSGAASAAIVNRTHRVVRQRAKTIQDRRTMMRSLWIPLSVCAGLFAAVLFAVWSVLEQNEIPSDGLPDLSQQMMVLMMWCLPLSLIVLAAVWLTSSKADGSRR